MSIGNLMNLPDRSKVGIEYPVILHNGVFLEIFDVTDEHRSSRLDGALTCPGCGEPMELAAGPKIDAYFRHIGADREGCSRASKESYLHKVAKKVVADLDCLTFLPEYSLQIRGQNRREISLDVPFDGKFSYFDTVIESTFPKTDDIGTRRRPDVSASSMYGPIHFEIHVTNKVDYEKEVELLTLHQTVLELDVSKAFSVRGDLIDLSSTDFIEFIRVSAPRRVVCIGKGYQSEADRRLLNLEVQAEIADIKKEATKLTKACKASVATNAENLSQSGLDSLKRSADRADDLQRRIKLACDDIDERRGKSIPDLLFPFELEELNIRLSLTLDNTHKLIRHHDLEKQRVDLAIAHTDTCLEAEAIVQDILMRVESSKATSQEVFATLCHDRKSLNILQASVNRSKKTFDRNLSEIDALTDATRDMSAVVIEADMKDLQNKFSDIILKHSEQLGIKVSDLIDVSGAVIKARLSELKEHLLNVATGSMGAGKPSKFPPSAQALRPHPILGGAPYHDAASERLRVIESFYRDIGLCPGEEYAASLMSQPWRDEPGIFFWALLHYEKSPSIIYEIVSSNMSKHTKE